MNSSNTGFSLVKAILISTAVMIAAPAPAHTKWAEKWGVKTKIPHVHRNSTQRGPTTTESRIHVCREGECGGSSELEAERKRKEVLKKQYEWGEEQKRLHEGYAEEIKRKRQLREAQIRRNQERERQEQARREQELEYQRQQRESEIQHQNKINQIYSERERARPVESSSLNNSRDELEAMFRNMGR